MLFSFDGAIICFTISYIMNDGFKKCAQGFGAYILEAYVKKVYVLLYL